MLVVTVELWPGGHPARAKEIVSIEIANISDLADVSDYMVRAQATGWGDIPPTHESFTIEGHPRRQSVFALLKTVFNRLGDTK